MAVGAAWPRGRLCRGGALGAPRRGGGRALRQRRQAALRALRRELGAVPRLRPIVWSPGPVVFRWVRTSGSLSGDADSGDLVGAQVRRGEPLEVEPGVARARHEGPRHSPRHDVIRHATPDDLAPHFGRAPGTPQIDASFPCQLRESRTRNHEVRGRPTTLAAPREPSRRGRGGPCRPRPANSTPPQSLVPMAPIVVQIRWLRLVPISANWGRKDIGPIFPKPWGSF